MFLRYQCLKFLQDWDIARYLWFQIEFVRECICLKDEEIMARVEYIMVTKPQRFQQSNIRSLCAEWYVLNFKENDVFRQMISIEIECCIEMVFKKLTGKWNVVETLHGIPSFDTRLRRNDWYCWIHLKETDFQCVRISLIRTQKWFLLLGMNVESRTKK